MSQPITDINSTSGINNEAASRVTTNNEQQTSLGEKIKNKIKSIFTSHIHSSPRNVETNKRIPTEDQSSITSSFSKLIDSTSPDVALRRFHNDFARNRSVRQYNSNSSTKKSLQNLYENSLPFSKRALKDIKDFITTIRDPEKANYKSDEINLDSKTLKLITQTILDAIKAKEAKKYKSDQEEINARYKTFNRKDLIEEQDLKKLESNKNYLANLDENIQTNILLHLSYNNEINSVLRKLTLDSLNEDIFNGHPNAYTTTKHIIDALDLKKINLSNLNKNNLELISLFLTRLSSIPNSKEITNFEEIKSLLNKVKNQLKEIAQTDVTTLFKDLIRAKNLYKAKKDFFKFKPAIEKYQSNIYAKEEPLQNLYERLLPSTKKDLEGIKTFIQKIKDDLTALKTPGEETNDDIEIAKTMLEVITTKEATLSSPEQNEQMPKNEDSLRTRSHGHHHAHSKKHSK